MALVVIQSVLTLMMVEGLKKNQTDIMNKQQKQEMGQGLVDFMSDDLSLDKIAETFEMKVDT